MTVSTTLRSLIQAPGHKSEAARYHNQGTATNGTQYAEINAGAVGALYQTIATIPGTTMYWSVDHSGRNGTDTMAVVMMPESRAKSITTQAQLQQVLNNPSNYGATVESDLSAQKGCGPPIPDSTPSRKGSMKPDSSSWL